MPNNFHKIEYLRLLRVPWKKLFNVSTIFLSSVTGMFLSSNATLLWATVLSERKGFTVFQKVFLSVTSFSLILLLNSLLASKKRIETRKRKIIILLLRIKPSVFFCSNFQNFVIYFCPGHNFWLGRFIKYVCIDIFLRKFRKKVYRFFIWKGHTFIKPEKSKTLVFGNACDEKKFTLYRSTLRSTVTALFFVEKQRVLPFIVR